MATILKSSEREFKEEPGKIDNFRIFTDVSRVKKGIEPQNLNFDLRQPHSWGDRIGRICDPFGNIWWITTHVEDLSTDEIVKRSQQKEFIEAMEYAQNSFNPLF